MLTLSLEKGIIILKINALERFWNVDMSKEQEQCKYYW